MAAVVGLSLLAAFLFAAASALEQRAAASEGLRGRPFSLIRKLIRRRRWIGGWFTNVAGFFSQTAALRAGNVAIVQPLLTTQLLFAVPLATIGTNEKPNRRDWAGAIAVCGGLAAFLDVRGAAPLDHATPDRARFLATLPFAAALVIALTLITLHPRREFARGPHAARPVLALLLGIAAGVCFAYSAALIVLTTNDLFGPGVAATARDWPGYTLAGSTLCGILLEQQAFSLGTLPPALATMTIANPVVAYVIGVVAFHTRPPQTVSAWVALFGGGVLLAIGVFLLAESPTARHAMPHAKSDDAVEAAPATIDPTSST